MSGSTVKLTIDSLLDAHSHVGNNQSGKCYCSLMYGNSASEDLVSKALAMAHSLRGSEHPLILLVTSDVSEDVLRLLRYSGLFDEIRSIDYILAVADLFKKDWFREVFSKLHILNLVEYSRVIFLDLDVIVNNVTRMDQLFSSDYDFAAMENSKGASSGSMWLKHGQLMGRHCKLINAGVIMVSPNREVFQCLVRHVTSPSPDHVPGMTPEQLYLARTIGHRFHHLSQNYNMEVQLHGGVPVTSTWLSSSFDDVVLFHFSGGSPLGRILSVDPEWGCQTEKRMTKDKWFSEFDDTQRRHINDRARLAFGKWAFHFASVVGSLRESDSLSSLDFFGEGKDVIGTMVDDSNMVIGLLGAAKPLTVNILNFKISSSRPSRVAPSLVTSLPDLAR